MSNPEIKLISVGEMCIIPNDREHNVDELPNSSQPKESAGNEFDTKVAMENESADVDLVILNDGNDIDNREEHSSSADMDDSQTASTRGSTTPVLESSSSNSPISELSEKSPNELDSARDSSNSPVHKRNISSEPCNQPNSLSTSAQKRLIYTKGELLKLMEAPTSRLWPQYFDISLRKNQGRVDMDKWVRAQQELKGSKSSAGKASASSTLPTSTSSQGGNMEKIPEKESRKSKDPRERIKDEQDGIVLSPQRRSFSTGCQVVSQASSTYEIPVVDRQRDPHRDIHRDSIPIRRIGSGRIIRRDEMEHGLNDRRRERENMDREQEMRRDQKDWRFKFENSRYEHDDRHSDRRRKFFDEDEKKAGNRRDFGGRDNRRYSEGRRISFSKEEDEPEWFTGGPSSQNEFIDLVGFEEEMPVEEKSNIETVKPKRERRRSRRENSGSARNSRCNTPVIKEVDEIVIGDFNSQNDAVLSSANDQAENVAFDADQDDIQFNVIDYVGRIINIGEDDMFDPDSAGPSRLQKFFKNRSSPTEQPRSSGDKQPSFTQVGSLLGFNEPAVRIPSPNSGLDSNRFFAPISPAEKPPISSSSGENIVDMLHQVNSKRIAPPAPLVGSGRLPPPSLKDLLMDGRGQILEELEADLRRDQQHPLPTSSSSSDRPAYYKHPGFISHAGVSAQSSSLQAPTSARNQFSDMGRISQVMNKKQETESVLSKLLSENGMKFNEQIDVSSLHSKTVHSNNPKKEHEFINRLLNIGNASGHTPSLAPVNGVSCFQATENNLGASMPPMSLSSSTINNIPQNVSARPAFNGQTNPQNKPGSLNADFAKFMQSIQKKQLSTPNYQTQPLQNAPFPHNHSDPIKQLVGGMNNVSMGASNQSLHEAQDHLREKLMRPDVQKILQRIINGQLTEAHLIAQLNAVNLTLQQKETIAIVLKILASNQAQNASLAPPKTNISPSPTFPQNMIGSNVGLPGSTISPRVVSPNQESVNMLIPQIMSQTRLSPLMCGSNSGPRRTPSHQEMVAYTQSIHQNALLKQELEKAKEKHRKKETDRIRSPNPLLTQYHNGAMPMMNSNIAAAVMSSRNRQVVSPSKGPKCQSPLAFTPTSVMRKMTAERDRSDNKDFKHDAYQMTNPIQQAVLPNVSYPPTGSVKVDKRMSAVPSTPSSMLGPRAQMVMGGSQVIPMVNPGVGVAQPQQPQSAMNPHQQRNASFQQAMQNMSLTRPNQHVMNNIRALQQAQQASLNQQMMRGQAASAMVNPNQGLQNRVPGSQAAGMQHLVMGNNNNYKFAESNNMPAGQHGVANQPSSFNLMNLFGHDALNKAQGALPELPGGKVLSLEEVERLQQTHS